VDVIPVSDPNIPSNAHRLMIAQLALQMAQQSPPGMFNLEALNRTILSAANMPNMEEILPLKQKPKPLDPVSDIMAAVKGVPIAAFPGQNHDAHIQVKTAYLQDPMNGASPIMQRIKPVLESNIQEHMVLKYQEQMMGITQMGMQEVGPQAPNVTEAIMAQAAQQVLNANQAMGQAQSPEQQLVAIEAQKLQLEQEKLQMTAAKNAADAALDAQKLELEQAQLTIDSFVQGQTTELKKEKADMDRASKETMKAIDVLSKLTIEQDKMENDKTMKALDLMIKTTLQQKKIDMDVDEVRTKALERIASMQDKDSRERDFKMIDIVKEVITKKEKEKDNA